MVGNYKIAGEKLRDDHMVHLFEESGRGHAIYLKDNYDEPYRTGASEDDTLVLAEKQRRFVSTSAFGAPAVRASAPEIATRTSWQVPVRRSLGATRSIDASPRRSEIAADDCS